ncbi:hypothetical protein VCHA53O466_50053 [Vibrio chagasii]|nr:hypothetical protein VCHA53O466_50053 [Vibrio chagasii]
MSIKLHKFLSREQITNFAAALSNSGVQGVKVRTKSLIEAIAKVSACDASSDKAYLQYVDDVREDAFTVNTKSVTFDYSDSDVGKLVSVNLSMQVKGYWLDNVHIHDGIIGKDGYMRDCMVVANIGGSEDKELGLSRTELMENSQITLNYGFGLAEWINTNKERLTPSDFDSSWKISRFGGKHSPKAKQQAKTDITLTVDKVFKMVKGSSVVQQAISSSHQTSESEWSVSDIYNIVESHLGLSLDTNDSELFERLLEHFNQ